MKDNVRKENRWENFTYIILLCLLWVGGWLFFEGLFKVDRYVTELIPESPGRGRQHEHACPPEPESSSQPQRSGDDGYTQQMMLPAIIQ